MSLAELHYGALIVEGMRERALRLGRLAAIEQHFTALPVDDSVTRCYGRIGGDRARWWTESTGATT